MADHRLDTHLAFRFLKTASLMPELGTYRWVGSFMQLIAQVEDLHAETGPVDVSMAWLLTSPRSS